MKDRLAEIAGQDVRQLRSVSGGCIADSAIAEFADGRRLFVKRANRCPEMFVCEANGLRELAKAKALRTPQVIHAEPGLLLLECIESRNPPAGFMARFGAKFAEMHRFQAAHFGFYEDNYIGATPQLNVAEAASDWAGFFYEFRLLPQLRLAEQHGRASVDLSKGIAYLESRLPQQLAGSEEPPCLLHGDLWSGNFLADAKGEPVIIDPAVYYGHREADLAMTRLFGGFSSDFYRGYEEAWPLAPEADRRLPIYQLYHILNHLNLFGGSYLSQSLNLLSRCLR
jgi:protein-ribulosamine 3-kinase